MSLCQHGTLSTLRQSVDQVCLDMAGLRTSGFYKSWFDFFIKKIYAIILKRKRMKEKKFSVLLKFQAVILFYFSLLPHKNSEITHASAEWF